MPAIMRFLCHSEGERYSMMFVVMENIPTSYYSACTACRLALYHTNVDGCRTNASRAALQDLS